MRPRRPPRHPDISDHRPAIREYDAKLLLAYWLERAPPVAPHAVVKTNFSYPTAKVAQISWDPETGAITPDSQLPAWVFTSKLVAKPDQLIKRRGKAGLLALNKTWDEAKAWISERAGKPQKVRQISRCCSTRQGWRWSTRSRGLQGPSHRCICYRDIRSLVKSQSIGAYACACDARRAHCVRNSLASGSADASPPLIMPHVIDPGLVVPLVIDLGG